MAISLSVIIPIILLALACEYVDSTLGMGYGTTLTPILMLVFGFDVLQIVPAVLLSELLSGLLAAFLHHKHGNVNLKPHTLEFNEISKQLKSIGYIESFKKNTPLHLKIAILLAVCSIAGTLAAVFIAVNIPQYWLKIYIGGLVLTMGIVVLICMNKSFRFSWSKMTILGIIASFNKGLSGGGYGPVVTSGQVLSGVDGKSAVGITSFAEGLTCFVGVSLYLLSKSQSCDLRLAPWLCIGSLAAVPLSAITVSKVNEKKFKAVIGCFAIAIGAFTLIKTIW
ncbi:MAG: sulfite exporter TauE/SafE family protein [Sedimentisphaeraceae bacterium JB056]